MGRLGLGGRTAEGGIVRISGDSVYVMLRSSSGCVLQRLDGPEMICQAKIVREVIKDFLVCGDKLFVLTKSVVTVHNSDTLVMDAAVAVDEECQALGTDSDGNVFLAGRNGVAEIRPLTKIEIGKYRAVSEIDSSVLKCLKVLSEFVHPEEQNEALTNIDKAIQKVVERLKANQVKLELGERVEEELAEIRQWYEGVELPQQRKGRKFQLFWQNTMRKIMDGLYDIAFKVLILLEVKGDMGNFEVFKKCFDSIVPLQMLLNAGVVFAGDFFFDYAMGPKFEKNVRQQLALLQDPNQVAEYLIAIGNYEMLQKFAQVLGLPYYTAMSLFKLGKLDEWIANLEEGKMSIENEATVKEIMKKLCEMKRDDLMLRLVAHIPEINEDQLTLLFLTMIDCGNMDEAYKCLWRLKDDRKVIDFLRILIVHAIDHNQVSKLFSYDFNGKLSMFTNELVCLSTRTLAVGAAYFNYIKDRSEAAASLYLYARSVLRSVSKESLRKAEAALALCCSIVEDEECCIRSVAENSLVDCKTILRLARRVSCLRAFDNPQDYATQPNKVILAALSKVNADKMITFCKLCSVDELCAFCQTLVYNRDFTSLGRLLELDKRTWNFALHKTALRAFLQPSQAGVNGPLDPPVWLVDSLKDRAMYDLLLLCKEFHRYDIVQDVFTQLNLANQKLSRYMIPLLESLGVPEDIVASIT